MLRQVEKTSLQIFLVSLSMTVCKSANIVYYIEGGGNIEFCGIILGRPNEVNSCLLLFFPALLQNQSQPLGHRHTSSETKSKTNNNNRALIKKQQFCFNNG